MKYFFSLILLIFFSISSSAQGTITRPTNNGTNNSTQTNKPNKPSEPRRSTPANQTAKLNVYGLSFGNVDENNNTLNDFGSTLYSKDMRYLGFQLQYDGLSSSKTKQVYVKIFNPDGTLRRSGESPAGYTVSYPIHFEPGKNNKVAIGSWGNNSQSNYTSGTYRVEFYWDGELQYKTTARIN